MSDVSLGILAGGKGRRLGTRDKGLVVVDGQPLLAHVISGTRFNVNECLICCRDSPHFYQHYADRLVGDLAADQGPVAGILALMASAESSLVGITPCDLSQLSPEWLDCLVDRLPADATCAHLVEDGRHTGQCLIRRAAITEVAQWFDGGGRALGALYKHLDSEPIPFALGTRDVDEWNDLQVAR